MWIQAETLTHDLASKPDESITRWHIRSKTEGACRYVPNNGGLKKWQSIENLEEQQVREKHY